MLESLAGAAGAVPDHWDVVDVAEWSPEEDEEPLGSKEKFWVRDLSGARWLFKYARTGGADAYVSGEDWAEIVATSCAGLLGVPAAPVRLGQFAGRRGTLSRSIVPEGWRLIHGNELLSRDGHPYEGGHARENEAYTVEAVRSALHAMLPPLGWRSSPDTSLLDGFDVWAGYLLFDAWVAGCDRHDLNWGAVSDGTSTHLAPSYDHGNALGFQVRPADHVRMTGDLVALTSWSRRGCCKYFAGRPRLVDLARSALTLAAPSVYSMWKARLEAVEQDEVASVLVGAPNDILSVQSRMFCQELLMLNRRRILDAV